ncbi:MAG TPA: nucleotide pyrophosphohydrolase [Thermoplasmata archaeon]|jgi:NTP pyrophosphatase (non-canonical NTP hydrolase)|nr:nucleotide pyrophosphohydrolase [Thermoplasmata archaeon]
MVDADTSVGQLRTRVAEFVRARAWESFHVPKDLAIALSIEASELLEVFLWRDRGPPADWPGDVRQAVADELADVLIYGLSLANAVGLDLSEAISEKLVQNEAKYPAERFRGRLP